MLVTTWIRVVLAMIIFTTLLQIAGVVTPLWIYLQTEDYQVGVGLYYRIGCDAETGGNCTVPGFPILSFHYDAEHTYDKPSWKAVTALETLSAIFGVILCILMIIYLIGFGKWKRMNSLNTSMVIISICALLPLAAGLIIYIIFYGLVISRSPDINARSFPWSALMCLVAGALFIAIPILIRHLCRNRNYLTNAIPTSTDSKMALNPMTKNQLMKRYFTPSPYREDRRQALYSSVYGNDQSRLLGNGFVAGAIETSGIDNRGFQNINNRAIEYNVHEGREGAGTSRVIETRNLSAGAFAGSGVVTNTSGAEFRGTTYGRSLDSLVRDSAERKSGTEVIERTYVTRTTTGNTVGNIEDRTDGGNNQTSEVNRQKYVHQQWQSSSRNRDDDDLRFGREGIVVGNQTTLNQKREYDVFSDLDAETIYYTGKEGFVPIGLSKKTNVTETSNHTSTAVANGQVTTTTTRQTLDPVQEEQIVREVTVIERGSRADQDKHFRIPADHQMVPGLKKAADYTVHTRTFTERQAADQLVLTPGYLSGSKSKYNGAYIYRPYSETLY